jgi:hypothetical protein
MDAGPVVCLPPFSSGLTYLVSSVPRPCHPSYKRLGTHTDALARMAKPGHGSRATWRCSLNDPVQRLLNDLDRLADEDADLEDEQAADPRESVAWLQAASAEQISLLLQELLDRQPPGNAATDGFLALVFSN